MTSIIVPALITIVALVVLIVIVEKHQRKLSDVVSNLKMPE